MGDIYLVDKTTIISAAKVAHRIAWLFKDKMGPKLLCTLGKKIDPERIIIWVFHPQKHGSLAFCVPLSSLIRARQKTQKRHREKSLHHRMRERP